MLTLWFFMPQAQLWVTHWLPAVRWPLFPSPACTLGSLARTNGRKAAFIVGTGAGVITGLTAALAVFIGSFLLFCIAAFMGGAYAAVALSFRFAATDGVTPERRARALSLVMGGGVIAGVVGPVLVSGTMHLWPPHTFAVQTANSMRFKSGSRIYTEIISPLAPVLVTGPSST